MNDDATINRFGGKYEGLDHYEARRRIVEDLEAGGYLVKVEGPRAQRRLLLSLQRATVEPADERSVVCQNGSARRGRLSRPSRTATSKFLPERLERYMNWMNNVPRLVHFPPTLVGAPHSALLRRLRENRRLPHRHSTSAPRLRRADAPRGRTCWTLWFLVRALAVFHARLAGGHRRPAPLLSDERARHRLRHHLLLGRADDLLRAGAYRQRRLSTRAFHGLVRDAQGRKMSKSLGNGIDPLEVIEQYGADALRFTLATGNSPGNDMRFSYEKSRSLAQLCQ